MSSAAADALTASFSAQTYGGRTETVYRFAVPGAGITPCAVLQAQTFNMPAFAETDFTRGGLGSASIP